jgi:hypothetical protein
VSTQQTILVNISLKALTGYTSTIGAEITAAVAAYISALGIGQKVLLTRLYVPAQLAGPIGSTFAASAGEGNTYEITAITIAISPGSPGTSDVTIADERYHQHLHRADHQRA